MPISAPQTSPLRLWPGVVLVCLQWLVRWGLPEVVPESLMWAVLGGLAGGLLVFCWWLFASRAPWRERIAVAVAFTLVLLATPRIPGLLHQSIAGGMMGLMFAIYGMPILSLALVVWAATSRRQSPAGRAVALGTALVLAGAPFAMLRTEGMTGDADSDFRWRWSQTAEQRLLAADSAEPTAQPTALREPAAAELAESAAEPALEPTAEPATAVAGGPAMVSSPSDAPVPLKGAPEQAATAGDTAEAPTAGQVVPSLAEAVSAAAWPGFRGPGRDSVVRGARVGTGWSTSPPVELWRRPIGPGWGSFAVAGNLLYTQEQRGEEEVVSCHRLDSGELVWRHADAARFWESNAGAGPRATPTLAAGRVFTLGATGILNALDAATGTRLWSRHAPNDTGAETPGWGFAGSPLVVDDLVIVATAGTMAAYETHSGETRWIGPIGGSGYSSPHLLELGGARQVLLLGGKAGHSVEPATGSVLWSVSLPSGSRIVQPAVIAEGELLLADGDTSPLRRFRVAETAGKLGVEEQWSTIGLKPYFSDFVVHGDFAYGFDGNMLAAIELTTGKRLWKGGRYGHGQLLLLADQDLLLVLSEKGELALVRAAPGGYEELVRMPAISGKTWNHPVLVGETLLVRNGTEMAAFRLPAL